MLDTLHDGFFYACYAIAAFILLHRALSPAVAVTEETPVAAVNDIFANAPPTEWIVLSKSCITVKDGQTFYKGGEVKGAVAAKMPTTSTAAVKPTVDDYSVRQLRQIAKDRGKGRIKNYKNISKSALFWELRSLQLV